MIWMHSAKLNVCSSLCNNIRWFIMMPGFSLNNYKNYYFFAQQSNKKIQENTTIFQIVATFLRSHTHSKRSVIEKISCDLWLSLPSKKWLFRTGIDFFGWGIWYSFPKPSVRWQMRALHYSFFHRVLIGGSCNSVLLYG